MRRNRMCCLGVLAALLTLLSGCMLKTVDQMYCLPRRSEEYHNLQAAMDQVMSGLEYCAPLQGENQQTVQMVDLTAAQVDTAREYGKTDTFYDTTCPLFQGLPQEGVSWMSHGDYMAQVPAGFRLVGHTAACPNVAIADETRGFYGVQFHPESGVPP